METDWHWDYLYNNNVVFQVCLVESKLIKKVFAMKYVNKEACLKQVNFFHYKQPPSSAAFYFWFCKWKIQCVIEKYLCLSNLSPAVPIILVFTSKFVTSATIFLGKSLAFNDGNLKKQKY